MKEIEISQIDTRFERLRLKDKSAEQVLLVSIMEQGIREPLQCVVKTSPPILLLDGFKRMRCAVKIGLSTVPVFSLGENESQAILKLLRVSNTRSLNILEQSALVDELHQVQGLSISDIARQLERSLSWVSIRLGLCKNMSEQVKTLVFGGQFPVRAYMYALLPFTRVKGIKNVETDAFVQAVSGKGLSARAIGLLAWGFFKGGAQMKEQILVGNLDWTIEQLKALDENHSKGLSESESKIIKDLEWVRKHLHRIPYELLNPGLKSPAFWTEAHLLIKAILSRKNIFIKSLEDFYAKQR